MTYQYLNLDVVGHIAYVSLNRPPVNALDRALVFELTTVAREFQNQPEIWSVVLSAAGATFCAGADLKERSSVPDDEVLSVVHGIQTMTHSWMAIPQSVIVGIQGAALGGGLELALAGDILVASEHARLGFPEVSLGIIPAAGGTQRLAQRTSMGVSKKWILSARQFTARQALEDGVVDFVVPADTFRSELGAMVDQFAANAPMALRQAKRAINESYDEWLRRGLSRELELYSPLIQSLDRKEALSAFAEKRKPKWVGKSTETVPTRE